MMSAIRVTTLGTGDAFASGGRGHSGILVRGRGTTLLIDPGPAVLPAVKRFGIEIAAIDAVLLTHLHGDHIAGVPFLLLDYQFDSRRTRPLIIAGPKPLATRLERLTTTCYDELSRRQLRFRLHYQLMRAGQRRRLGAATVAALPMAHSQSAPCLGYRIQLGNKLVAFTGDTAWCDSILRLADGADLFLTECTGFRPAAGGHLDYLALAKRRAELRAKRIVLVHVGKDLLRNRRKVRLPIARDGQTFLV
jgi:ribonuclease BN (tRNA processing enzyme)